jgi:hypothetical protein
MKELAVMAIESPCSLLSYTEGYSTIAFIEISKKGLLFLDGTLTANSYRA